MNEEPTNNAEILVESIFGVKTRRPYVQITWGQEKGLLTPNEARAHALVVLECAESAESDAFLMDWVATKIGANLEAQAALLMEFRKWRDQRGEEGKAP